MQYAGPSVRNLSRTPRSSRSGFRGLYGDLVAQSEKRGTFQEREDLFRDRASC